MSRGPGQALDDEEEEIKRLYRLPGHPTAFSAPKTVAEYHGITEERARRIVEAVESYVTHREFKRPRQFNPYYIRSRRDFAQADLIDMRALARVNGGVKFILLVIDCFSRFVWTYPLKTKSGAEVAAALRMWLDECGEPPRAFSTDLGREFFNPHVRDVLGAAGVEQQRALGTCKASLAERANKSIQVLLYKYMSDAGSSKYVGVLDRLTDTYNNRPHRSLNGLTPAHADLPTNEAEMREVQNERFAKVKKKPPKFKLNEIVRVKIDAKALEPASRAYNPQFKDEFYVIRAINDRLPVPLYYLTATEDDEEIEGGFYSNELTRVAGDVFRVERELERRRRGRRREVLVKWQGFSDRWNSWVPEDSIRDI